MHGENHDKPVTHNVVENGRVISFVAVPVATLTELRDLGTQLANPDTMNALVDAALDKSGLTDQQIEDARRPKRKGQN